MTWLFLWVLLGVTGACFWLWRLGYRNYFNTLFPEGPRGLGPIGFCLGCILLGPFMWVKP